MKGYVLTRSYRSFYSLFLYFNTQMLYYSSVYSIADLILFNKSPFINCEGLSTCNPT